MSKRLSIAVFAALLGSAAIHAQEHILVASSLASADETAQRVGRFSGYTANIVYPPSGPIVGSPFPTSFCASQLDLVNQHLENTQSYGAMVVTLQLGEAPGFFFRGAIDESGKSPDANTIFELASVTKVFTTAILAMRHLQNNLSGSGSVKPFLPPGYDLSSKEKDVTFQQLATFTGGFEWDDPPGFNWKESFSQSDFQKAVNLVPVPHPDCFIPNEPPSIPGAMPLLACVIQGETDLPTYYYYSNGSIGFLGQILMFMDGESYPPDASVFSKWISANLTGPLNMNNTAVEPGGTMATGYSLNVSNGKYSSESAFLWQPWGAAGALRSNANDMLKFLKANICAHHLSDPHCAGLPQNVLNALAWAHGPNAYFPAGTLSDPTIYTGTGKQVEQAWAWEYRLPPDPNNPTAIISKNGGHPGFSTWIGFSPEKSYGLVILMNTGKVKLGGPAQDIIDNTPFPFPRR